MTLPTRFWHRVQIYDKSGHWLTTVGVPYEDYEFINSYPGSMFYDGVVRFSSPGLARRHTNDASLLVMHSRVSELGALYGGIERVLYDSTFPESSFFFGYTYGRQHIIDTRFVCSPDSSYAWVYCPYSEAGYSSDYIYYLSLVDSATRAPVPIYAHGRVVQWRFDEIHNTLPIGWYPVDIATTKAPQCFGPLSQQEEEDEWIVALCTFFGSNASTMPYVAATFPGQIDVAGTALLWVPVNAASTRTFLSHVILRHAKLYSIQIGVGGSGYWNTIYGAPGWRLLQGIAVDNRIVSYMSDSGSNNTFHWHSADSGPQGLLTGGSIQDDRLFLMSQFAKRGNLVALTGANPVAVEGLDYCGVLIDASTSQWAIANVFAPYGSDWGDVRHGAAISIDEDDRIYITDHNYGWATPPPPPPPRIVIESKPTGVIEGGSSNITVRVSSPPLYLATEDITVALKFSGPVTSSDYDCDDEIIILRGQSSASTTLTTIEDYDFEIDDFVEITIGSVSGGDAVIGTPSSCKVWIFEYQGDSDPTHDLETSADDLCAIFDEKYNWHHVVWSEGGRIYYRKAVIGGLGWPYGTIPLTALIGCVRPTIHQTADGALYIYAEDVDTGNIYSQKSTDAGYEWGSQ